MGAAGTWSCKWHVWFLLGLFFVCRHVFCVVCVYVCLHVTAFCIAAMDSVAHIWHCLSSKTNTSRPGSRKLRTHNGRKNGKHEGEGCSQACSSSLQCRNHSGMASMLGNLQGCQRHCLPTRSIDKQKPALQPQERRAKAPHICKQGRTFCLWSLARQSSQRFHKQVTQYQLQ
jgi:hypothetical protein